jgi:hypothetical protein
MNNIFYEVILPSQGVYCVATIRDGALRHHFAETITDLLSIIASHRTDSNVFVAPNTFRGHSRKADNALFARSFFVDLDVGTGKPYSTKRDAIVALDEWVKLNQLPPPILVDSGNGVHGYWAFEQDVPVARWKTYAEKFKSLCLSTGLAIDPVVTADASRIMRAPDTQNFKQTPPIPTGCITGAYYQYDFEKFVEFLGEEPPSVGEVLSDVDKDPIDADSLAVAKLQDDYEYVFSDIAIASLSGKGCNQIKFILENAKSLPEPLWYAGISVASRCVDKATAIHEMSEDYDDYSFDETERKAAQSLREATWAHGCEAFDRENPGTCAGCPHRGKISSPIRLGRRLKQSLQAATEEVAVREEAGTQVQDTKGLARLPAEIWPFARGASGGIYFLPASKVDKDGNEEKQDPILVFRNDVYPIKRVVGGPEGDVLTVRHHERANLVKEFNLPIRSVYVQEEMKKRLPENGVYPQPAAVQYAALYFFKWAEYLQAKEDAEIMRMQMGWTESKDAFVFGNTEILADGTERPAAASPMVRNVSKIVGRAGSYDVWKQSAQALNAPGWEMPAFGLLCGFASPMMHHTNVPGVTFAFTSALSGTCKSGSMYAALSVFAKPREICIQEGNATDNALVGRYLNLKNILFGIDEASNIDPLVLSKMVHRISQGKAKLRMQSSVNAERELEQSASLLCIVTSNLDLYDVLKTEKASPDGEMARLIQFMFKKPLEMQLNTARGVEIFEPLHTNYGHAGPDFIKFYYKKGEAHFRRYLEKWMLRLRADFSDDSAYRHYVASVAAVFASGELANEAGIISYDLERIYDVVIIELIQIRDGTVKLNDMNYGELLAEFINTNHAGILILEEADRVVSEPRMALVGRIEVHKQRQMFSKTALNKFLNEKRVSSKEFVRGMEKEGMLSIGKQRLSTGWKAGMVTPPIPVYIINTPIPEEILKPNA